MKPPYSVSCREGSIKYRCGCGVLTLPVPCHDTQALQNCNLTERRIILVIHYTSRSMVDLLPTGHCLQLYSVATLLDKKNCLRWNPPKGTVAVFFIVCAVESSGGSTSKGALNVFSRYVTYLRSASDFLCCSINSLIGLSFRTGI